MSKKRKKVKEKVEEPLVDEQNSQQEETPVENGKQVRRWMLTINNPKKTDKEMEEYIKSLDDFKYAMFQRERGHQTGTEHIQLFLIFKVGKRFTAVKKMFEGAHIEPAGGSNVQCRDYCCKSDTRIGEPVEIGEFAEMRTRNDLKTFYELIENGADNKTLMKLSPNLYMKNMDKVERLRQELLYEDLADKPKKNFIVIYIYGKSGVGKTYNLFMEYGKKACFISNYAKNPFDTYRNQDIIVFDEFRSQIDFSSMLKYIDVYPVELPRRYADKYGNYTKVFILSNWPPNNQYSYMKQSDYASWEGFSRRITYTLYFKSRDKIVVESAKQPLDLLKSTLPQSMTDILDEGSVQPDGNLPF